eukprot:189377-Rhodomonas_salina.1
MHTRFTAHVPTRITVRDPARVPIHEYKRTSIHAALHIPSNAPYPAHQCGPSPTRIVRYWCTRGGTDGAKALARAEAREHAWAQQKGGVAGGKGDHGPERERRREREVEERKERGEERGMSGAEVVEGWEERVVAVAGALSLPSSLLRPCSPVPATHTRSAPLSSYALARY